MMNYQRKIQHSYSLLNQNYTTQIQIKEPEKEKFNWVIVYIREIKVREIIN